MDNDALQRFVQAFSVPLMYVMRNTAIYLITNYISLTLGMLRMHYFGRASKICSHGVTGRRFAMEFSSSIKLGIIPLDTFIPIQVFNKEVELFCFDIEIFG